MQNLGYGQLSNYLTEHRKPIKKAVAKIEVSLHEFAKGISQVEFVLSRSFSKIIQTYVVKIAPGKHIQDKKLNGPICC